MSESECFVKTNGNSSPRATTTCSIGIGRQFGSISWDVTVYNVAQPYRQDFNIIATLHNADMDKGSSLTIPNAPQTIVITNVDNAPVYEYDLPDLKADFAANNGDTKVQLEFAVKDAGLKWTTDDCGPGSVVFSGGRESWSCDFPCTLAAAAKEL